MFVVFSSYIFFYFAKAFRVTSWIGRLLVLSILAIAIMFMAEILSQVIAWSSYIIVDDNTTSYLAVRVCDMEFPLDENYCLQSHEDGSFIQGGLIFSYLGLLFCFPFYVFLKRRWLRFARFYQVNITLPNGTSGGVVKRLKSAWMELQQLNSTQQNRPPVCPFSGETNQLVKCFGCGAMVHSKCIQQEDGCITYPARRRNVVYVMYRYGSLSPCCVGCRIFYQGLIVLKSISSPIVIAIIFSILLLIFRFVSSPLSFQIFLAVAVFFISTYSWLFVIMSLALLRKLRWLSHYNQELATRKSQLAQQGGPAQGQGQGQTSAAANAASYGGQPSAQNPAYGGEEDQALSDLPDVEGDGAEGIPDVRAPLLSSGRQGAINDTS